MTKNPQSQPTPCTTTSVDNIAIQGVARGGRQRSMIMKLLAGQGIATADWDISRTQTRIHGSAGAQVFRGMQPRLALALTNTGWQIQSTGYQRFVLVDEPVITSKSSDESDGLAGPCKFEIHTYLRESPDALPHASSVE